MELLNADAVADDEFFSPPPPLSEQIQQSDRINKGYETIEMEPDTARCTGAGTTIVPPVPYATSISTEKAEEISARTGTRDREEGRGSTKGDGGWWTAGRGKAVMKRRQRRLQRSRHSGGRVAETPKPTVTPG